MVQEVELVDGESSWTISGGSSFCFGTWQEV